jgi:hypothetical protein
MPVQLSKHGPFKKEGDMLKSLSISAIIVGWLTAAVAAAPSTKFGAIDEAKAMLQRAIAEMKTDQSIAISKFNHNDPGFRDRDLFVFCFDRKTAKFTAHEALVGWDVRKIRDAAGRSIGDAMFATAKEGQLTEIVFSSPIPGTTTLASKLAYITAIGNQVCGVSAYLFNGELGVTQ